DIRPAEMVSGTCGESNAGAWNRGREPSGREERTGASRRSRRLARSRRPADGAVRRRARRRAQENASWSCAVEAWEAEALVLAALAARAVVPRGRARRRRA